MQLDRFTRNSAGDLSKAIALGVGKELKVVDNAICFGYESREASALPRRSL